MADDVLDESFKPTEVENLLVQVKGTNTFLLPTFNIITIIQYKKNTHQFERKGKERTLFILIQILYKLVRYMYYIDDELLNSGLLI